MNPPATASVPMSAAAVLTSPLRDFTRLVSLSSSSATDPSFRVINLRSAEELSEQRLASGLRRLMQQHSVALAQPCAPIDYLPEQSLVLTEQISYQYYDQVFSTLNSIAKRCQRAADVDAEITECLQAGMVESLNVSTAAAPSRVPKRVPHKRSDFYVISHREYGTRPPQQKLANATARAVCEVKMWEKHLSKQVAGLDQDRYTDLRWRFNRALETDPETGVDQVIDVHAHNAVHQTVGYMLRANCKYGMITCWTYSWLLNVKLLRNNSVRLLISDVITQATALKRWWQLIMVAQQGGSRLTEKYDKTEIESLLRQKETRKKGRRDDNDKQPDASTSSSATSATSSFSKSKGNKRKAAQPEERKELDPPAKVLMQMLIYDTRDHPDGVDRVGMLGEWYDERSERYQKSFLKLAKEEDLVPELELQQQIYNATGICPQPFGVAENVWRGYDVLAMEYLSDYQTVVASDLQHFCVVHAILASYRRLHAAGYIHGDIRLPNIMIREVEDTIDAKLIDFGMSSHRPLKANAEYANVLRMLCEHGAQGLPEA